MKQVTWKQMDNLVLLATIVGSVVLCGIFLIQDKLFDRTAYNETYITALQSQVESLTNRVEQLEGRE